MMSFKHTITYPGKSHIRDWYSCSGIRNKRQSDAISIPSCGGSSVVYSWDPTLFLQQPLTPFHFSVSPAWPTATWTTNDLIRSSLKIALFWTVKWLFPGITMHSTVVGGWFPSIWSYDSTTNQFFGVQPPSLTGSTFPPTKLFLGVGRTSWSQCCCCVPFTLPYIWCIHGE